ncbi:MAG: hypothetical protein QXZ70_09500 [Candidatus Bathyarchaeia archaeon]
MKRALGILLLLSAVLVLILIVETKAADFSWKDDFTYADQQQMQAAGWQLVNKEGIRFESDGVVLDGTKADTIIRYRNHFPSGVYDWSVETRSMWLGIGHSGPGLNAFTEKHSYGVVADGWYNHFAFERDGKIVTFGNYNEQANVWITMTMTKKDDTINVYLNGQLIYTHIEEDKASYKLIGVDRIAPWRGVMLYDYYQVAGPDVVSAGNSGGPPIFYIAVGGGVAALIVVGAAVYFFFIAGGSTAATAAAGVAGGATTGALSGAIPASIAEIETDALSSFASNLVSDTVADTLNSIGYMTPGSSEASAEPALRSDFDSVAEAVTDMISNTVVAAIEGSGNVVAKLDLGATPGLGGQSKTEVDVQVGEGTGQGTQGSKTPDWLGF